MQHLAMVVVALVPQLLSRPGLVDADTKSYLLLDPSRYLRQSLSMWDPSVGLGTVTHQQIGYLFPMGPFFLATHALGVPSWIAQRMWVAVILLGAGFGVRLLCRTLELPAGAATVAGLAYMMSPYPLQYIGHISVILLSWAALPWLLAFTERALHDRSWRWPALFALLAAGTGSVNATSALYVAVAPALWLVFATLRNLARWQAAWRVLWRCGLLSAAVSAWWVVGLVVEGRYGIDVLKYTETVRAVASTSLSSEVLRGLGYWYFYGTDSAGPWVTAMPQFTGQLWLLGAGYGVPMAAFAGAFVTRWRWRAYFVLLGLVGTVLAVGAYPFAHPSAAGSVLRSLFAGSELGLALRSTDRAAPLVVLALAMLVGAALAAVAARSPLLFVIMAGAVLMCSAAADPALWNGSSVPRTFVEPASPPAYVTRAATSLDQSGGDTRVLAVPGQPFASYRYGTTVDPVWPALLERPFVTREQQVMGSLPSEDLLAAIDDPFQSGTVDPRSIAPLAQLISAGDVLVQNDLAYERYHQPDPSTIWSLFSPTPAGLGNAQGFGAPRVNDSPPGAVDEQTLALGAGNPPPPPVATVPVDDPRPLVRSETSKGAVVIDGDGAGLVAAADAGMLAGNPTLLYAGTLDSHPTSASTTITGGAQLVVTDSNRRQAYRWDNIQNEVGATLAADQKPSRSDSADQSLNLFPEAPADAQTTSRIQGVASVYASSYGNPFAYFPEDRPVQALDGNPDTAWEVDTFGYPAGQWWQVTFDAPRTLDQVTIVQPQVGDPNQWLTEVTMRFDGKGAMRVRLGPASRTAQGQTITFAARRLRTLQITIDATNLTPAQSPGASPVGLAEVKVADVAVEEQIVMPGDLLHMVGTASLSHRLTYLMTRERVAPAPPRTDPESSLDRALWLPTARTFTLTGTARIDDMASDTTINSLVGRPEDPTLDITATATQRLTGDLSAGGDAAVDGDPATVWSPPFGRDHQVGQSLTVTVPEARAFSHLDLLVVADHRHSVPTALRITSDSGSDLVLLPAITDRPTAGSTVAVPVDFAPLTGRKITVTIAGVRIEKTTDDLSDNRTALPIAVAELGLPSVLVPSVPLDIPNVCRAGLLTVDGAPVYVRLQASSAAALAGTGMSIALCGPDAAGLELGPGNHVLRTAVGALSGVDVDQVVLDSAPGGGPEPADRAGDLVEPVRAPAPTVKVLRNGSTTIELSVARPTGDAWLVLGESLNPGWRASAAGGPALGQAQLIDGYANGWLLTPAMFGSKDQLLVTLHFAPQDSVDVALWVSLLAGLLCLALAVVPRRRRGATTADYRDGAHGTGPAPTAVLGSPFRADGPPPAMSWSVLVAGAAVLLTATLTPLWAALCVGLAVLWAHRRRNGRAVLALGATGFVMATAFTMVVIQATGHYAAAGGWASHFGPANSFTWGAWILLGADVLVECTRGARSNAGA